MARLRSIATLLLVVTIAAACTSNQADRSISVPSTGAPTSSTASTSSTTSTTSMQPTTTVTPTTATTSSEGDPQAERPFAVSTSIIAVVDSSRPTPATDTDPELTTRTIEVWLYLPDRQDPAPLIVFSHGLGGHPDKFEELHQRWAEAGYAVAAPAFPLTNITANNAFGNAADGQNQPADVTFVLDHLLQESDDPDSNLADRFDANRIGAAGLSLGGATTYEVAINTLVHDDRFSAAIVMAGARFTSVEDATFAAPDNFPVYILHGDADPLIPLTVAQTAFDSLTSPAYFLTLLGGGHAGPFENAGGLEPKIPGMDELIHESTIAFWDYHLLDDVDAADQIEATATAEGLSVFEAR